MKAALCTQYGLSHPLQIQEIEKPSPHPGEVLIRIHATTVTTADWRVRSLEIPRGFRAMSQLAFGLGKPRQPILGTELAGTIESVGMGVTQFKPGDSVIAVSGAKFGCHAEYRCVSEKSLIAHKPTHLSFEEAAALSFGGMTALDYLRDKAKIKAGDQVLINGASGSVGLAAVQLAKYFGAEVTAVCSAPNFELVKSLGASYVIDYKTQDFTQDAKTYDIILDAVGNLSFKKCGGSLKKSGRLLLISASLPDLLQAPWISFTTKNQVLAGPTAETAKLLKELLELVNAGAYKPIIDRTYPLEQINEAYQLVATRHKKGNVVITLPT